MPPRSSFRESSSLGGLPAPRARRMQDTPFLGRRRIALLSLLLPCACLQAQVPQPPVPASTSAGRAETDDEVIVLSPFEVSSEGMGGYNAKTTLAGNRLNTQLRDVGSAVSVITPQFMKDTGAVNNATLLQYVTNAEVGGVAGNFAGVGDAAQLNESTQRPNENTRIRGLAAADNTRDFFRTEIPWDGYNIDRVDLQRGPNSILFGQGSPAGIINAGAKSASFRNFGQAEVRLGSYGSFRTSLDLNRDLLHNQVALRVNALRDDVKYRQDPAYSFDRRIAGSLRVEPAFLKKGSARTIFKANFEAGRINSNNPRELPPVDTITPWFTQLNQATYTPSQLWDHLSGRPNHGQERPVYAAPLSGPIPYYTPWIGAFGNPVVEAQPVAFFSGSGAPALWITEASQSLINHAIGPDGKPDGGFASMPQMRMRAINPTSLWAGEAALPYSQAGVFKDNMITDPSIFDFYNHLIDGDTKREWQRFHSATFNLTQTFFDEALGFSFDYNKEHYNSGQVALLGGYVPIGIDPMAVFADGTPDAGLNGGEPYSDGTPNPNVGRPFVSSKGQGTNSSYVSDREAKRATGFFTHDFSKGERNWLNRLLGSHTVTGLVAEDQQKTDSRVWQRYGLFDDAAYTLEQLPSGTTKFDHTWMTPESIIYLGPSLKGQSIYGAAIPGISGNPVITSGKIRYFDDHWNKPTDPGAPGYVDPAAPWTNGFYIPGNAASSAMQSTQSENPANYVGWTTTNLNVTDSEESQANRDKLTTSASLRQSLTTSQALVWQGRMVNNSIVGTYGWRKDINKAWGLDRNTSTSDGVHGQLDLSDENYKLPYQYDRVEVQSRSYSIVAHLMDLPWLSSYTKKLPFEISLSYNMSTNFKPDASRKDIYGESISSPGGKTIDRGIQIETRDGRYSLKVTRYATAVTNASSSALSNPGAIGTWMTMGANFANVFEYNIGGSGFVADPSVINQGDPQRFNFRNADNSWDTEGEAKAIAGFRAFQRAVDPRFYSAWGMDVQNFGPPTKEITSAVPTGFAITEDSVSTGWEIELNAEPIRNWRLTLNASKSEAVRSNVGGKNMSDFMNLVASAVSGDAGQLHYWWGTADVPRSVNVWYESYIGGPGAEWAAKKLQEGTNVPEIREWRVNLVTNYDFTRGFLKGVNVGGGVRYQSAVAIGYPPTGDYTKPAEVGYDLSHPYKGPSETNIDLWIGYKRKLTDKINWRIQLNVANAFKGDDLIPITVQGPIPGQPAGTPAGYRIAPAQTFTLTNTFDF